VTGIPPFPAPWPWEKSYPAGLSPRVELPAWPLGSIIDRAAEHFPEKDAIVFRGTSWTYAELKARVDEAAAAFLCAGLGKGARVALFLPNTLYHPLAFFGAMKAGATVVHLSPLDSPRVIQHKLADSGARVVITTNVGEMATGAAKLLPAGIIDRLIVGEDAAFGPSPLAGPMPSGQGVRTFEEFLAGADTEAGFPLVDVEDLALLQYTGGTTGMPKGAKLTHRNLSAAVSSYDIWYTGQGLSQKGDDRILLFLPLFHIYALTTILLRGLNNGNTLLMHTRFDAETALAEIENGATSFPGVPTMWIAIAAVPGFENRNFSSMRYCASGGAPLPVEVARKLKAATGHDLLGGWGMTETSPAGTNIPKGRGDKVGTIGVPLPGIYMDIVALDDPTRVLPQGETGELRIFGDNVTKDYLNREDEHDRFFSGDGFLTGDIGFIDKEGFFTIVDRKKDMIISGGFNVYPQLIEQMIYEHPDVHEVLVIGVPDAYRGEAAKAFVTLRKGAPELTLEALREFLKDRVGKHEMPAHLEIRESLPRTSVGKLSKLELKQEEAERRKAGLAS
jgi:long-chain acyl-CoA synthetase